MATTCAVRAEGAGVMAGGAKRDAQLHLLQGKSPAPTSGGWPARELKPLARRPACRAASSQPVSDRQLTKQASHRAVPGRAAPERNQLAHAAQNPEAGASREPRRPPSRPQEAPARAAPHPNQHDQHPHDQHAPENAPDVKDRRSRIEDRGSRVGDRKRSPTLDPRSLRFCVFYLGEGVWRRILAGALVITSTSTSAIPNG